jgi:anti-sigma B factor antagonist
MADLHIATRSDGDVARVVLTGEFDLAGVGQVEAQLAEIEKTAPAAIVVDLSGLQFMDSSGLRTLVIANDRARRAQRRFAIVPGPPQVRRVFEITQLTEQLELVDDVSAVEP